MGHMTEKQGGLKRDLAVTKEANFILAKDLSDSRISDCLLRNDRPDAKGWLSLKASGGRGNLLADNLSAAPAVIPTHFLAGPMARGLRGAP